ncbi:amidohydrolase family protein [Homoserinibacter sp. YIM 151385]|nr:amidohydrolase family protein [Homoserinibacter sp. YIM 151385]WBU39356.1 amidohydrolase family protein [Homoserinibacter sp. YIM 151385]
MLLRRARLVDGLEHHGGEPLDLLLEDGRILVVGTELEVPDAEVVELDGRWVTPGLWDEHVHFSQHALTAQRLDVAPAASAAEVARLVRERVVAAPPAPGEPLIGYGFRDGLWPDEPEPAHLDAIGAPVVLVSGDVHCTWANRAALHLLGMADADWLLREQPAFDLGRRISAVPVERLDAWAGEAARQAAARGVVGISDLEMDDAAGTWLRRIRGGTRELRVRAAVYPYDLERARTGGIRTGAVVDGSEGLLEGGNFKLFTDGSLNTRTAYCHDPYPGLTGAEARGLATHEPAALLGLARDGLAAGLSPTIHAIGDAAVALAIDALEALGDLEELRGTARMEHVQLIAEADVPRLAALDVTASVQPEHAMDDREVADRYWAGRTGRSFAFRALHDAGVRLALGSDAPVAPLDPWIAIAAATTRSRDGLEPWHPEQALERSAALAASTHGGVLEPGSRADLAILDADPLAVSGAELRAMPVAGTLLGARWTHREL